MKAEDTVMSDKQIWDLERIKYDPNADEAGLFMSALKGVAQAQAEISFKIAKTLGVAETMKFSLKAMEDMKKAGIKEVVEWIGENTQNIYHNDTRHIKCLALNIPEWQAKLQEWGYDGK